MTIPCRILRFLLPACSLLSIFPGVARAEKEAGNETGNKAPAWVRKGAYVFRVSTPDERNVLPRIKEGAGFVSGLLDGSVTQIMILNGIIGHDHPGPWNWDGSWPYWNRPSFRAGNDWKTLAEFMTATKAEHNALMSFHLNITDVNTGLGDYPETRAFFQKLVDAQAIYRRDLNKATGKRDLEPPYVPREIAPYITKDGAGQPDPVNIFALVNYKRFWESGLAREMFDTFYGHLPYAPPLLYLDVFNLAGGNFSTGYPDGLLGGSEKSQLEGAISIIEYLRSKGSDLATEGDRPIFGNRAGFVWLHGQGYSADDYSVISGGHFQLAAHHVFGNNGSFNVSPIALTPEGLERARAHYAALLQGKPATRKVAGAADYHIAWRAGVKDEFDIPGTGDPFRGDWVDLVNNFYLATIQELYHIGLGNTRARVMHSGGVHLGTYTLTNAASGKAITVSVPDFVTTWQGEGARKAGQIMLETPIVTKVTVPEDGKYTLTVKHKAPGRGGANLNIYLNDTLQQSLTGIPSTSNDDWANLNGGTLELKKGENRIAFDIGIIRAIWTDGTVAEWKTPYLGKGFSVKKGDLTFAEEYDRMWPDTWSGGRKIYFFSWDGARRAWRLPPEWAEKKELTLYPLTPAGRGKGIRISVKDGSVSPVLLPQVPYVAE